MEFNYLLWFGQFFYFLFAVFLAFYLPGRFFLLRVKLANFERSVLSVLLGMVLWGWQGFIFGYLHLRWLTYVYLFIFLVVWLKKLTVSQFKVIRPQIDKITASIIILGSFLQLTATWFVGTNYNSGLYFCCGNSGDNTLYAAITNEIVKRFPPFESGMYGVLLQNYHYWGNLVIAELIRVFHLPIFPTSFQFIMFFLSVSLGLSGLVLAKILNLSRVFYRWLLFFLYFGSDAIFFLMLLLHRKNIFGMSSLEDGIKFLSNPSRAFAVVVFFAGLCLFVLWIKKRELKLGFIMAVIFGALIGFKVYIGIFALSGLGVLALYFLYKKEFKQLLPILLAFLLSAVIYFPVNKGAGGLYYIGFWRFENFISQPALGLLSLDMAREIFVAHNNWIKVFIYEALYVVIYISAIFGTKLIGLFQTRNTLSYLPKELHILLITGITVSFVAGIFFEQTSGGSNTFNFLVSVFIIGSLYTALVSMDWTKRLPKTLAVIVGVIIIFMTVPRIAYEAWHNFSEINKHGGLIITKSELEGLYFLKNQTPSDSIVLIDNLGFLQDRFSPYITLLADRPVYLSGIDNELMAHNINYRKKEISAKIIFSENPLSVRGRELLNSRISYILTMKNETRLSTTSAIFLDPVFANDLVVINKVSKTKIKDYLQWKKTHKYEQTF